MTAGAPVGALSPGDTNAGDGVALARQRLRSCSALGSRDCGVLALRDCVVAAARRALGNEADNGG